MKLATDFIFYDVTNHDGNLNFSPDRLLLNGRAVDYHTATINTASERRGR